MITLSLLVAVADAAVVFVSFVLVVSGGVGGGSG